jgi:hypothetical protein
MCAGLERVSPDGTIVSFNVHLIRSKVVDKAKVLSLPLLDPLAAFALSLRQVPLPYSCLHLSSCLVLQPAK